VIPPDGLAPGVPTHPIYIPVYPAHPIVIPPDAVAPGVPEHPIYFPPVVWPGPGYPAHPIVIPPDSLAPGVPSHPIVLPPSVWPPDAKPEHPIELPPEPPDLPNVPPVGQGPDDMLKPPPESGGWGYNGKYGWGYFPMDPGKPNPVK
jgi:hypothetical protein